MGEISVLALAALLLVAGMIWIAGLQETPETPESVGSSVSASPRGALALYRWLDRAGFEVERVGAGDDFPPGEGTMLSLNPNTDWPEGQAGLVRGWVERGNTLIMATGQNGGDQSVVPSGMHPLLREFGIGLEYAFNYTSTVSPAQPLFADPPVDRVKFEGIMQLSLPVTGTTVLVSSDDEGQRVPLAAMVRVGAGSL
jgi:hypothetical protein